MHYAIRRSTQSFEEFQSMCRVDTQSKRAMYTLGGHEWPKDCGGKPHPLAAARNRIDLASLARVVPEDFFPRNVEIKNVEHVRNPESFSA